MPRRSLRTTLIRPLSWSPIAALIAQLLMAGVVGAVTGGGDFPVIR